MPAVTATAAPLYRHTQTGRGVRLLVAIGPLLLIVVGILGGRILPFALAFALGIAGFVFTSLTVEITATELVWHFGFGFWRNSTALASITSATVETNKWWWGWGIHLTPRGWLYNVGGMRAVEVANTAGKRVRIGSDEPEQLAAAINDAIRGSKR